MEPFVHLHVHTEYSLLDGANRVDRLVEAAVRDGHQALAITDHGNLHGAVEFYQACRKAGVQPILGCEVYVAERSMRAPHHKRDNPYSHLTLLCRDAQGWRNLMDLVTAGSLEGQHFRPRVDLEYLSSRTAGLTCLSGCMSGPVNKLLRREEEEAAVEMAGTLRDLFGAEHFFLEVMRNGIAAQDRLTTAMARLKDRIGAPLVATNDIHYLRHEDCAAQDALICLHTNSRLSDPDRWRMDTDTLYFRERAEMNRIFGDLPEALRNTLVVAEQVELELEMGRPLLPAFEPPDGSDPDSFFTRLCEEGFRRLYPNAGPEARERLDYEMRVIREMGFVAYFLIVWDLVRHARQEGIPVGPGRGSAAGSLVAYVLGITRIDPLRYDLLFERFLNPSRISMPDIDIDFCKERREEMIEYARKRYGDDRVCQIITFGKLKAKNALRDMARILEIPLAEADRVAKKIPDTAGGESLERVLENDAELNAIAESSPEHRKWFQLARQVEGLTRNASVHAAGVIIADRPLQEIVPLAKIGGSVTTQWDMKACEKVGLLKMDFLGLRTLTILHEAARLVRERTGEDIDLEELPLDDEDTYRLLQRADTEGVFQLESSGMRNLLAEIAPRRYEDVIAVLALFRPGPLGSDLHIRYAQRMHGREPVEYPHPLLEPVLEETYGVMLYQEQIMRVAQRMGGFSLADADSLRKAMGKKDMELMESFGAQFLAGARERGVDEATAKEVWEAMLKFGAYGFNKSHSAGYAMVTYQAAWMKAHHPAEFFAASLTFEADHDTDKLRSLIEDARRHGIEVLPPCVLHSESGFTVASAQAIRFGLRAIKGMGGAAADALVEARAAAAPPPADFDAFLELAAGAGFNRSSVEALVKSGACDVFGEPRLELLADLDDRLRQAAATARDRARGQGMLFGGGEAPAPAPRRPAAPRESGPEERRILLQHEKEALGLYLSHHPLDDYRDLLDGISPWNSRNLAEAGEDAIVAVVGVASQLQIRPTRKDPSRKMARLKIEDLYGSIGAVVFPSTLEKVSEHLTEDFVGIWEGRVSLDRDEPELLVERIRPLAERAEVTLAGMLEVELPPEADLDAHRRRLRELEGVLRRHSGEHRVRLVVTDSEGRRRSFRLGTEWGVRLDGELMDELRRLLGEDRAHVVGDRSRPPKREAPRWKRGARGRVGETAV